MTEVEVWKTISEFPNYQVSSLGRVRNISTGRVLKGFDNGYGYLKVELFKAGKGYTRKIHRLVAEAFLENPENLPQINHRDEDKANNVVSNLEWCSHEYNINYGTRNERAAKANSIALLENKNSLGKKNAAKPVKCVETGEIFGCAKDAARKYNLELSSVSHAANPNHRQKTAGGYHWQYVEDED